MLMISLEKQLRGANQISKTLCLPAQHSISWEFTAFSWTHQMSNFALCCNKLVVFFLTHQKNVVSGKFSFSLSSHNSKMSLLSCDPCPRGPCLSRKVGLYDFQWFIPAFQVLQFCEILYTVWVVASLKTQKIRRV